MQLVNKPSQNIVWWNDYSVCYNLYRCLILMHSTSAEISREKSLKFPVTETKALTSRFWRACIELYLWLPRAISGVQIWAGVCIFAKLSLTSLIKPYKPTNKQTRFGNLLKKRGVSGVIQIRNCSQWWV